MNHPRTKYALQLLVLFAAYLATAKSGLNAYSSGQQMVTVIWPPSGIALAGLLLFGYKVWPAIPAAVFVLDLTQGHSVLPALELAAGNTLEPLLGAYLLQRVGRIHFSLDRLADVLNFIIFAAVISTFVGATVGTTSLLALGSIHQSSFLRAWSKWWIGDVLGVLVVTPFILVWSRHGLRAFKNVWSVLKGGALIVCLLSVSIVAFWGFASTSIKPFILAYGVFPLMIWASLRFRQLGSVTAIFIASIVAIGGTVVTYSHAGTHTITNQLFLVQTFLGATAATFMIISAGVLERDTNYQHRLKLATHADELSKQKVHLQALNQAKDDFISIASHQLKTPPTVIKQYVGLLLDNKGGSITEKQRVMLQHVYDSNEKQLRVIRDILNIAQLDTGHVVIHRETVDLVPLISDVIKDKVDQCARRRQSLSFVHARTRYEVYVDRLKLYIVLGNIIDNASKYTPEGKAIEIKLTRYNAFATIAVKDQGVGFSTEDTHKLFRKFTRISNASVASIEGTGIGLYWAKKIIDLHGGNITAKSRPGYGSTFRVSLPVMAMKPLKSKASALEQTKAPAMQAGVTT